jgi:hypothetical protein
MDVSCNTHGRDENSMKSLVGNPKGKRPRDRLSADGRNILK